MKDKPSPKKKKNSRADWRRLFVAGLALLMVAALVLPLLGNLSGFANAATQSELKNQISGLKGDAADATARRKELEDQLKAIESDKAQALQRKQLLDQELYAIDAQLSNTQGQIDLYNALIAEQEAALAEAQAREDAAYARFCQRARSMEESGDISYWSVLFAANDFSDLLDRLAMVDLIMEYDNSVVEALVAARQAVETTLAELNTSKGELDEQKAVLDVQRAEQAAKVAEAQALFDELKTQADKAEALVAAQEAEEKAIATQIAKKEKELEELIRAANFTTGSGYYYPLPSSNTSITSKFGWRTHPLTKKPNNHTGIDIAAPKNTEIYAVQGGVVITSAYAPSSYGNYVVVSHGNGRTTLYAHMTSRAVSEGQVVSQGQVLGYVGMTGSASGNHLHLELKVNGVRQDPRDMFPGVNFSYPYG
ncbi:murein hydrolase activator EnvC family protein [Vermiculatibacterium agrestimuris]|uniref:murein hydrolase activator EnvC family protein n=1 Tax=Vermiculatibacterium agrestimuris TaxID=2941519 RepID=UPI00203BD505|nr:M23 family metallopeptidase [Vermiculatibacterium agrestimuris]